MSLGENVQWKQFVNQWQSFLRLMQVRDNTCKTIGMKDEEFRIYKPVVSLENGLIKKDTRESF